MGTGRIEMKFLLRRDEYEILRDTLRHWGQPDPYAGDNGVYPVFSQYYDSGELRFFYDKINGEWEHVKIRVRQYTNRFGLAGLAFLEAKIKKNNWQKKLRIPVDDVKLLSKAEDWSKIDHPDIDYFTAAAAILALAPVCNVYYEREAFLLYDGPVPVRVNFDTNIAFLYASEKTMSADMLEDRRMLKEYGCVLEVKTESERLPRFLQGELRQVDARMTTFSKYTTGVIRLDEWNRHNEVRI